MVLSSRWEGAKFSQMEIVLQYSRQQYNVRVGVRFILDIDYLRLGPLFVLSWFTWAIRLFPLGNKFVPFGVNKSGGVGDPV